MSPQAICDAFLDTNADIINENANNENEQKLNTDSAYHQATCIIGNKFGEVIQAYKQDAYGAINTYYYKRNYRDLQ